jgi:outer membrane protein assembly factor BamB
MKSTRYVCLSESDHWLAELSYIGGAEAGKGNPSKTDVKIRLLSRVNPQWPSSPWHVQWEKSLGDLSMPTGAWNGISLVEIVDDLLFYASSNRVVCASPKTGEVIWHIAIGNTSVEKIMASKDGVSVIVYNGYFGFEDNQGKGNIVKISQDGQIVWRAELPSETDIYANPPYYDKGVLCSNSWECFRCEISEKDGMILSKQFTK